MLLLCWKGAFNGRGSRKKNSLKGREREEEEEGG